MVEPVRQHFQHKCWRERGYVFERFLSEPELLAWHRTAGQLWVIKRLADRVSRAAGLHP
jgi:hypothetical protein